MLAAISPTMRRTCSAVEWRKRNRLHGASAFPRARGTRAVSWRRGAAALARRARPATGMRSSDVGSAQCRSSKARTTGCVRAPARNHAVIAASCRRRNSSGANFAARSWGSGMSTSGAIRGAYSPRSRPTSRSVFSRSARRCSAGRSSPNRCRPHSASGCSGVFCKSCEAHHSSRCVASRRVAYGTLRSGATCRGRARRRSARTGPRLRARASQRRASSDQFLLAAD